MDRESIFSWLYDPEAASSLSGDVSQAELARQAGNHRSVQEIFETWTQNPAIVPFLEWLALKRNELGIDPDLIEQEDLITAGLAGLGRIKHVNLNSQLQATLNEATQERMKLLSEIYQVHDLYTLLDPPTLPPWTIHRGSICWMAEIAQDQAKTFLIIDDQEGAREIVRTTLSRISEMNLEIGGIDFETPEDVLKAKSYQAFRQRKEFLGAFSAQGVLWLRLAELDHNLEYMLRAVNFVSLTHLYEPNPHRLATVAVRTLRATLSLNYHGSLLSRVCGVKDGGLGFIQAFFSSPSATISSLKQFLREKR